MADDIENSENIKKLKKLLGFQPLRFVHIFFSIILTLYGTGILLATLTVKTELAEYVPFLHYYLEKPLVVLFLGSIALVGLGCLGIISSAQNLYQGIVTFGVLVFGLFMFKLTMGLVFLAVSNSADRSIILALQAHINNYTEYSDPMDYIQTNLSCCGINDFTDWNLTLGYIPGSCCSSDNACGTSLITDIMNLNEIGCYAALKELIDFLIYYLVLILGILAGLQVTVMVITFFLARGMADYRRRISQCNEKSKGKVQNPLGLRNNRVDPLPEKMLDEEIPEIGIAGREGVINNPLYRDDSFNSNNNQRRKIAPTAPRLPQAHRKYPVGILRQGYKR